MKKALISIAAADVAFLGLLWLTPYFGGVLYYAAYALAFILPFGIAIFVNRRELCPNRYLKLDRRGAYLALPLVPITILTVILLSVFTSVVLNYFGMSSNVELRGSLPMALVEYALLPAVFEELLFRYLPLRLMSHLSAKHTVLFSSLIFAAVHLDPFQLVYAFAAGAIFMTVDILTDSIIPSLVIHFINNALSVLTYFLKDYPVFVSAYLPTLLVLSALAAINIASRRTEYMQAFKIKLIYDNL